MQFNFRVVTNSRCDMVGYDTCLTILGYLGRSWAYRAISTPRSASIIRCACILRSWKLLLSII